MPGDDMNEREQLARVLAEHEDRTIDLTTPRQYTQFGGWNEDCICGFGLPDAGGEGGDERVNAAHNQHIADVILAAGFRYAPTVLREVADETVPNMVTSGGVPRFWLRARAEAIEAGR